MKDFLTTDNTDDTDKDLLSEPSVLSVVKD
jgi:hypothetical protein